MSVKRIALLLLLIINLVGVSTWVFADGAESFDNMESSDETVSVGQAESSDGSESQHETEEFTISEESVFWDMKRSWLQGYQPTISYDRLALTVPIRSASGADNVKAELIAANESISPLKPQTMTAGMTWVGTGLWVARFSLKCHSDRVNGDYPCTIHVTGIGPDGAELVTDIPYILHIRDGKAGTEPARMELTDEGTSLKVGEDGALRVTLANPSKSTGLENLALTVSDPEGDILPGGADSVTLPDLMPGQSVRINFPVTVRNDAKVAPHSLHFDLEGIGPGSEAV